MAKKECQKPEGSKTYLKARHLAWKSICVLPLFSKSERSKRSFPCHGASFLTSHANKLGCKVHFPGSFLDQRTLRVFSILHSLVLDGSSVHSSCLLRPHLFCPSWWVVTVDQNGEVAPKRSYPTSVQPHSILT